MKFPLLPLTPGDSTLASLVKEPDSMLDGIHTSTLYQSEETMPIMYPLEDKNTFDDWKTASIGTNDSVMRESVEKLLSEYGMIFKNNLPTNHECRLPPYHIALTNLTPIKSRPYKYSVEQLNKARQQVETLLNARAIERAESAWSSPIVLVSKKDGGVRMCIDYRKLNAVTMENAALLPRIDAHLTQLGRSCCFTTLDMTSGYHQIRMSKESRHLTAFCVDGTGESFQWRRMPFGLRNAPVHFMRSVASVLKLPYVLVYIDDIIVHSRTAEDHLIHLKTVFEILRKKKMILKPMKCTFMAEAVTYLGHNISIDGLKPIQEKFLNVKSPQSKAETKSLIGLLSFYRKFIHNFAQKTENMQKSLKSSSFIWDDDCEAELKLILREFKDATLYHPNFDWLFAVFTDASNTAIGAVVHQINPLTKSFEPLGFYSRKLTVTEQRYAIAELEALALVYVTERCPELLAGKRFMVFCDNRNLVHILKTPTTTHSTRLTRYGIRLSEFIFDIVHISTKDNAVADYLSRYHKEAVEKSALLNVITRQQRQQEQKHHEEHLEANNEQVVASSASESKSEIASPHKTSSIENKTGDELKNAHLYPMNDLRFHQKNDARLERYKSHVRFVFEEDILYFLKVDSDNPNLYQKVLVIPSSLVNWMLTFFHENGLHGHRGFKSTIEYMQRHIWFRGMRKRTLKFIKSCHICQMNKVGTTLVPKLQPLMNSRPMERLQIDLVGPLPPSAVNEKYILCARDAFSRFIVLKPLKSKEAKEVANQLMNIFGIFGVPSAILSDNGKEFRNGLTKELARLLGMKRQFTTPYRPQTNGAVERSNRSIHAMMRAYLRGTLDDQKHWPHLLPMIEYAINTAVNRSIGYCPFQLMFGHSPNIPGFLDIQEPMSENEHVRALATNFQRIWQLAKMNREKANEQMILEQPRVNNIDYKVGQLVKVFSWKRTPEGLNSKWLPVWLGPFTVIKTIGTSNILISDGKKNQMLHVSRTHPYHQRENTDRLAVLPELPEYMETNQNTEEDFEIDYVLAERHRNGENEFLIKWTGYGDELNSWEPERNVSKVSVEEFRNRLRI